MAVTPFQLTEPFLMDGFNSRISEINTMFNGIGNEYVWEKRDSTSIVGYVNSPDPNAYPPAVSDGYTYTPLGQIGAKVQIATGSYTGTGTYGSNNPNSLTFEFVPKFVIVYRIGNYSVSGISAKLGAYAIFFHDAPTALVSISESADNSNNGYLQNLWCEWNGNQLSWYSNKDANKQLNWKNKSNNQYFGKYGYIAIV